MPPQPQLPVIEYTGMARDYWCSIPASQAIPVRVRRGFFGLYQVDLTPQTEAIRRFRQSRG